MNTLRSWSVLLGSLALAGWIAGAVVPGQPASAFPGAIGFGSTTPAGRGGRVIKVTNLDASGPGSLTEALQAKGPRVVVFEVGGLIDLGGRTIKIVEPYLTVAGQTAPSPGISLIRGGVTLSTHDVLLQHLRIRTGDDGRPKQSGWEVDSLATSGASNVVIDHCSLAWGTDENLSASGSRFAGRNVEEWRRSTSHDVTFSHCIVAEGLSHATHSKGEHSKGSLIHDNATRISIIGNLYASNLERNPLFKGGAQGVIVNNLIDNPGRKAVHYNLLATEWEGHSSVTGQMVLVGNVLQAGPDSAEGLALLTYAGDGPLDYFAADNLTRDRSGQPVALTKIDPKAPADGLRQVDAPPFWPEGLAILPAAKVKDEVLANAGARPWDRDEVDRRIVRQVNDGTGHIIDSQEQVGGYPTSVPTTRKLVVPENGVTEWLDSFCQPAAAAGGAH